ncbi:hypothetical protein [Chromohalobacter sp.]|uniref:hypothetical protein n=1 Tax=Chromohalobacter sp. TaxID=50740 RepID=UPI003242E794
MIDDIYSHHVLNGIVANTVEEEGIEVEVGRTLLDSNGDIDSECAVILKPDDYYSTRVMARPPKSVDNVVVTHDGDSYRVYVIELKSTKKVGRLSRAEIHEKFLTVVERFFSEDFPEIFMRDFDLADLALWLVCDPFGMKGKGVSQEVFDRKVKSCGLDAYASMKPLSYKGKLRMIKPMLPPPVIEKHGCFTAPA